MSEPTRAFADGSVEYEGDNQPLRIVGWSKHEDCHFQASDHCTGWHGDDIFAQLSDGHHICADCLETLSIVTLDDYHGPVPNWQTM